MIKQTEPRNGYITQHFACYGYDLLYISEAHQGIDFDFDRVNSIYKAGINSNLIGYMIGEMFYSGENHNPLDGWFVEDATGLLALSGCQNTKILMGPLDAGMWPIDTEIPERTGIIQKWHNDRTGFSHYVVGNPDGTVQWDPIERSPGVGSRTVAEGRLVSLRLIQFV